MLEDILRPDGNNPSGALKLHYTPAHNLASIPPAVNGELSADPVFHPGKGWLKIEITEGKLEYQEETNDSDNGSFTRVTISGFVRGDSAVIKSQFAAIAQMQRMVVKCMDNAKLIRIAGTPEQPLSFKYKFTTSGLRGYSFEFSGELTEVPPVYNP